MLSGSHRFKPRLNPDEILGNENWANEYMSSDRYLHIQGLRGIAVIAVVLFHLEELLPGGFAGVDVFFVISGFVVTKSALRLESIGRYSFKTFIARRIRRLAPALALATITSLLLFCLIFPAESLWITARTAVAQSAVIANLDILRTSGSYFAASAELNGFLHYWSLSVEEQFFIFFPIIFSGFVAKKKLLRATTATVAATTFAFSFALTMSGGVRLRHLPDTLVGYYASAPRFWQFGVGIGLACLPSYFKDSCKRLINLTAFTGFFLVIASFFIGFDHSSYPNWTSLLPTIGGALLVLPSTQYTRVGKLLGSRPFTGLGTASYSLYLWHWPFIVIAQHLSPGSLLVKLLAVFISFCPAFLSARYVEYRWTIQRPLAWIAKFRFILAFLLLPSVVSAAIYVPSRQGLSISEELGTVQSELEGEIGSLTYFEAQRDISFPCGDSITWDPLMYEGFERCRKSKAGPIQVVLLGDSHAEHLFLGLAALQGSNNLAYFIEAGGPIVASDRMASIVGQVIADTSIDTILLSSAWSRGRHLEPGFKDVFQDLMNSGKTLWVIGDVPEFDLQPYNCKFRTLLVFGRQCETESRNFLQADISLEKTLKDLSLPDGFFVSLRDLLCDDKNCSMRLGEVLLYRDDNHLNAEGSILLATYLANAFPELARDLGVLIPLMSR